MGLEGIWIAKVINEFYIFVTYILLIRFTDWNEKAQEAVKRQNEKL